MKWHHGETLSNGIVPEIPPPTPAVQKPPSPRGHVPAAAPGFAILGLGTALPATSVTQERAAELTSGLAGHDPEQARRLAALYRRTGIDRRHVTLLDADGLPPRPENNADRGPTTRWRMERYDDQARSLALEAAGRALELGSVAADRVTHLVTVSCTGFAAPGFDLALVRDLALSRSVERTHVGFMGCHGALNGLRVARAFALAGPSAVVLVCATELCSLHFQYGDRADRAVSNALFGDGAAALVGTAPPGVGVGPTSSAWNLAASGSWLVPETEDAMTWQVGDHGFEMSLSARVPALIGEHLKPWLTAWLGQRGLSLDSIASWAIHPGGPKVLNAVEDALGLERPATADSRAILAGHGNMSSPTILFILDRLRQKDAPRPCLALAFGPGLVIEAALFV